MPVTRKPGTRADATAHAVDRHVFAPHAQMYRGLRFVLGGEQKASFSLTDVKKAPRCPEITQKNILVKPTTSSSSESDSELSSDDCAAAPRLRARRITETPALQLTAIKTGRSVKLGWGFGNLAEEQVVLFCPKCSAERHSRSGP